jgi:hypothetical protein
MMLVGRERVHINWFRGQLMMPLRVTPEKTAVTGPVCELNRQSLIMT